MVVHYWFHCSIQQDDQGGYFSVVYLEEVHINIEDVFSDPKTSQCCPFYEFLNEQVLHMFNEMGYQPTFFSLFLQCLIGRSVGLDKAKLEIYAMVAWIYYDL